jgi:hypothetical protein
MKSGARVKLKPTIGRGNCPGTGIYGKNLNKSIRTTTSPETNKMIIINFIRRRNTTTSSIKLKPTIGRGNFPG